MRKGTILIQIIVVLAIVGFFTVLGIVFELLSHAQDSPRSRYAGICSRRCGSGSRSIVEVTLVDPALNKRTREKVYIYSSGHPAVVCRCQTQLVRHRTRADRESTNDMSRQCGINCRQGVRLFMDVRVIDPDGREHREDISILEYDAPIACLCTPTPPDPPPPPRGHPRDH